MSEHEQAGAESLEGKYVCPMCPGVTLVKGDLRGILKARRLSCMTMRNIRQNLFFAFVYNGVGVPIAAGVLYPFIGLLLSPMIAAAAMSLSSVSVISYSLRLRRAELWDRAPMDYALHNVVGNFGVLLIVGTYFLVQIRRMSAIHAPYIALNGLGALCILYSLYFDFNLSAFLIEAIWLLISVIGLLRVWRERRGVGFGEAKE